MQFFLDRNIKNKHTYRQVPLKHDYTEDTLGGLEGAHSCRKIHSKNVIKPIWGEWGEGGGGFIHCPGFWLRKKFQPNLEGGRSENDVDSLGRKTPP